MVEDETEIETQNAGGDMLSGPDFLGQHHPCPYLISDS